VKRVPYFLCFLVISRAKDVPASMPTRYNRIRVCRHSPIRHYLACSRRVTSVCMCPTGVCWEVPDSYSCFSSSNQRSSVCCSTWAVLYVHGSYTLRLTTLYVRIVPSKIFIQRLRAGCTMRRSMQLTIIPAPARAKVEHGVACDQAWLDKMKATCNRQRLLVSKNVPVMAL